ncbi:DUF2544 domain-containing protein [Salmonella enterica]|nr:DUF2544 domain-containing protein [Salmonella enterica]ELF9868976.1 DUF2544 domain-containing protein [Salmonella enterica]
MVWARTCAEGCNVAVNTSNIGSGQFTSTCSFQYIIDEL